MLRITSSVASVVSAGRPAWLSPSCECFSQSWLGSSVPSATSLSFLSVGVCAFSVKSTYVSYESKCVTSTVFKITEWIREWQPEWSGVSSCNYPLRLLILSRTQWSVTQYTLFIITLFPSSSVWGTTRLSWLVCYRYWTIGTLLGTSSSSTMVTRTLSITLWSVSNSNYSELPLLQGILCDRTPRCWLAKYHCAYLLFSGIARYTWRNNTFSARTHLNWYHSEARENVRVKAYLDFFLKGRWNKTLTVCERAFPLSRASANARRVDYATFL
jgi:hypothetical protein